MNLPFGRFLYFVKKSQFAKIMLILYYAYVKLKLPQKGGLYMKKKIFTIMLTVFIFCVLSVTAFAVKMGDVTGDDKITAADARKTLRHSAGIELLSEEGISAADVDNSGKITASDARKILRESAGLTKNFQSIQVSGKLVEDGVLNVAVCANTVPFVYAEGDELKGINIEMAKKIADYYELELNIHTMSKDELDDSVRNNQCDIAFISVDYIENKIPEGVVAYNYYRNTQEVYFRYSEYSRPTIDDLKGDVTKKVGVVENSIADVMVTRAVADGELNCVIRKYSRFKEGAEALRRGTIDAFIGYSYAYNEGVSYNSYLANDSMLMVSSSEKKELLDVLKKPVSENIVKNYVDMYCPVNIDSKISTEAEMLIIPDGATSIMKINVDSFYGYMSANIVASPYPAKIVSKEIRNNIYEYYLVLSIPAGANCGTVKLEIVFEPDVTCELYVQVEKDYAVTYNFGMQNSMVPDFGSVMVTAPDEVNVYPGSGIAYIYDADSLIAAGVTTEHLLYYLSLMEQQGFVCTGEDVGYGHYQLMFENKQTGEKVSYTESYVDDQDMLDLINIYLYCDF